MRISLAKPDIRAKERKAVLEVLSGSRLALGPRLEEFEKRIAEFIGVKYAVAVNSGTSGLHLLIRALGIGKGDEVITTPFSFIASSNCILYEGAKPVFVDIESRTLNISPDQIEKAITRRTKAILAVDTFGHPAEWDAISKIAKRNNLRVIEDACEAFGSEYKGVKCGSFGDAGVFAFYPNKQITTGEGGMIVTNSKPIADVSRSMSNQGRLKNDGRWLEHVMLGYNYRMDEMSAALGIAQLERIDEIMKKRKKVAELYQVHLRQVPEVEPFPVSPDVKISWFTYVVRLRGGYTQKKRDKIIEGMKEAGIQCGTYFKSIHLSPFYQKAFGYGRGDFPVSENASLQTIVLPFFNTLKESQIKYIVGTLKEQIREK
jgi:perosamine synthetase